MKLATPREVGQLPSILTVRKNLQIQISLRQKEILIGTILGDSYISKLGKIQVEHSAKQKTYLEWKFSELKNLSYKKIGTVKRLHKLSQKEYKSYRFWLRQYFRLWRIYFYKDNKKIFPQNLRLTPLSLAVWYMDDGCYSDKRCTISTDSFNYISLLNIQKELKRLKICAYIRSNNKIGIRSKSQKYFFHLIQPFLHEDMLYKLP